MEDEDFTPLSLPLIQTFLVEVKRLLVETEKALEGAAASNGSLFAANENQ